MHATARDKVFQKALDGIQRCDLFFVWAGPDFNEAFGTLVEIGYARALNKPIVIGMHPNAPTDTWFALRAAGEIVQSDNPVDAYKKALETHTKVADENAVIAGW